ncbi:MAG: DbpA RNA binding domain-containing protein [Treponema sp.]|jgi:hypothetical protein|nr:DbpA RNA binding domain-containing protein [Treponema sp.]
MPPQFDKEKTKKTIKLILEKLKTEADPQLLSKYRSLFKKEVSFFRRSWAAAYLLLLSDQGAAGRFNKNRSRKFGGAGRDQDRPGRFSEKREPEAGPDEGYRNEVSRYPLAEEESRRLFLSVGRNRRVFPREILGLINAKTAIPREDIGAIRILDNYSFVQVRDTVADKIIDALNGQPFRGRTLSVNYARARRDGGEGPDLEEREEPGKEWNRGGTRMDTNNEADFADGSGDGPPEFGADRADAYSGEDWEDPGESIEAPDEPESLPEQDEDHPDKENI